MKKNKELIENNAVLYQLVGWLLFILCALCFLVSSLVNQDFWALSGSLIFLLACLLFIWPLVKKS